MPESLAAVLVLDPALSTQAADLAGRFSVPCIDGTPLADAKSKELQRFLGQAVARETALVFVFDPAGLSLRLIGNQDLSIRCDFHGASTTYRRIKGGGRGQMIAKAVGFKGDAAPSVLDCTAGLGGDAFVLASLGCEVSMLERVAEVRALLQDGLRQATKRHEPVLDQILARMRLIEGDAHSHLASLKSSSYPDVVYLDPMFPERNKSALVKKEMRVFHQLVGDDADADELLPAALTVATKRVVVKRPRIAPALSGLKPSHVLEGKRNRYDIYVAN